jgi:hypothetical protein
MYVSLVKPSPQRGRSNRRGTFSGRRRLKTYLVLRVALIRSSGHQTEVYYWGWGWAIVAEALFMEKRVESRRMNDEGLIRLNSRRMKEVRSVWIGSIDRGIVPRRENERLGFL